LKSLAKTGVPFATTSTPNWAESGASDIAAEFVNA